MDSSGSASPSEDPAAGGRPSTGAAKRRGRGRSGKAVASGSDSDDGRERGRDAAPRGGLGRGDAGILGAGGRRRRRPTDKTLLGVFAEGSGDEERRPGRGARARDRAASPLKTGIAFVRGDTMSKSEVAPRKASEGEGAESDDSIDPRFRFDGVVSGAAPVEQGPRLPSRNKLSFGQMATNYGKGFAMLQKMGFQGGGLGARQDGIANPIEVLRRKDRQGLQDEGEMLGQDLYGHDAVGSTVSVEELLGPKAPKGQQAGPKPGESWQRATRAKKPRTVYKTAAEVANEPHVMRIVDMRGPEVRVAASFSELAASISGDTVKSLKELRHNARLLVARYEDKVRAAAESRRHSEDVLLCVARERERLEAAGSLGQRDVSCCRQIAKEVEALRERQDAGNAGLAELASAFGKLRAEHPKEFKALRVLDVAVALALPAARRELAGWRPLDKPERGPALLGAWRALLEGEDAQAFTALCDSALLPLLRAALCDWSVQDCEPCLRLFECCRERLPTGTVDALTAQVLLPRLRAEVDAWDPRVDKVQVHLWVHPWLPALGARLECLWAPLRFKLSKCLDRWNPRDHSAVEVMRPWRLVFDPSNWEPLMEKVLVRLEQSVADMRVRPDGQDVAPIKDLLAWAGLAPSAGLVRVLEAAFFPQWHAALSEWLHAPGCDFGEVLQWYQGWKALLPQELREEPDVQRQFAHGLHVMRHFMAQGGSGTAGVAPVPQVPAAATPEGTGAGRPRRSAATPAAAAAAAEEVNLSLADYLAEVAGEQGLVFRPKANVLHLGKQVYQLGVINVYLSKNLVYAAPKGGMESDWNLVSLDEALGLARGAPVGRGRR